MTPPRLDEHPEASGVRDLDVRADVVQRDLRAGRLRLLANHFRPHLQISPVLDCQACSLDEKPQLSLGTQQDLVDDVLGRCDVGVAVVPRKLSQFEQIKHGGSGPRPEHGFDAGKAFCSTGRTANSHVASVVYGRDHATPSPECASFVARP